MALFYFLGQHALLPGSTVAPGDLRREFFTLRHAELSVRWPQAVRELVYEEVRLRFFPNRPSRLSSHCLFENLDQAVEHVRRFEPNKVVHEVETIPGTPMFKADLTYIRQVELGANQPVLAGLWAAARQYWEDRDNRQIPELISEAPVRVMRLVET